MDFLEYRKFAEGLVQEATKLLNKQKIEIIRYKDRQDILTNLDLATEKLIIDKITKKYPSHSIISEERGEIKKNSDWRWIIDPIDGTKSFVRGLPFYGSNIALEYKGEIIASAMYFPELHSLYSASRGSGSTLNGKKLSVSKKSDLSDALAYAYLPNFHRDSENYETAWEKLKRFGKKVYRVRGVEGVNLAFCWVALGACEAYLNLSNPPLLHDLAPGMLVAQEAGAVVSNDEKGLIAANNKEIYNQIMEVIS